MALTALDSSFLTLDQQIESLKDEIKQQMETLDRLNREQHETGDATRHLDSLLRQFSSLALVRHPPG